MNEHSPSFIPTPSASPSAGERHHALDTWRDRLYAVPWWVQCVALWLVLAVGLSAAGLEAVRVVDLREGYDPVIGVAPDSIPGIWARWDSPYYVHLAQQGYAELAYAMGYFPLYPLLMASLARLSGLNLALSGMLISQVSYLIAILFFYKVARLIRDDHRYAMWSTLYLTVFPSSFFFFAVYAEPLSLAFSVLGVYLALRARPNFPGAGLALGLAAAARPVGWLLDIILGVEFLRRRRFNVRAWMEIGVALTLSISGIVLFVLYLYTLTGSFTAITEAQALWRRTWQFPWITLWTSIRIALTGNQVAGDWFLYVINWSDLLFTLLALALTILAIRWSLQRRFPWSLSLYLAGALVFLMSTQGLQVVPLWGMTRWVGALFPIHLILGRLEQYRVARVLVALASAGMLVVFAAWWMTGRWVG
jgi:hypothetical protein